MRIDSETLDTFFAPVVISWDGNEALLHAKTGLFVYYTGGKAELKKDYVDARRNDIIGLFGYEESRRKYMFTVYTPRTDKLSARIIPEKAQMVTNNSVQVDAGESIQVQNHQRVIKFSLAKPERC